jgi:hypothetical protein
MNRDQLSDLTERAELEVLRDAFKRLINFDGGAELMPWVAAHRMHKTEPYIGCPFCRDEFVTVAEVEEMLREVSRDYAGAHVNAGSVVGTVRKRLREIAGGQG